MASVVIQGLGEIGLLTAQQIMADKSLELVGAVDPKYKGKHLEELLKGDCAGLVIGGDTEETLIKTHPDAVVCTISSYARDIFPQAMLTMKNGARAFVTSAEEMFFPSYKDPDEVKKIDALAKEHGTAVIGTGVNPGALMDMWPWMEYRTAGFDLEREDPDELVAIYVKRVRNTNDSRENLLDKTGAGIENEDKFRAGEKSGEIGHVGLEQCAAFLEGRIFPGRKYRIKFERIPVFAKEPLETKCGIHIKKGMIAGLQETCRLYAEDKDRGYGEKITLKLSMFAGAEEKNSVEIFGYKSTGHKYVKKEFNVMDGDSATAIILSDAVNFALNMEPGMHEGAYCPPYEKVRLGL